LIRLDILDLALGSGNDGDRYWFVSGRLGLELASQLNCPPTAGSGYILEFISQKIPASGLVSTLTIAAIARNRKKPCAVAFGVGVNLVSTALTLHKSVGDSSWNEQYLIPAGIVLNEWR